MGFRQPHSCTQHGTVPGPVGLALSPTDPGPTPSWLKGPIPIPPTTTGWAGPIPTTAGWAGPIPIGWGQNPVPRGLEEREAMGLDDRTPPMGLEERPPAPMGLDDKAPKPIPMPAGPPNAPGMAMGWEGEGIGEGTWPGGGACVWEPSRSSEGRPGAGAGAGAGAGVGAGASA